MAGITELSECDGPAAHAMRVAIASGLHPETQPLAEAVEVLIIEVTQLRHRIEQAQETAPESFLEGIVDKTVREVEAKQPAPLGPDRFTEQAADLVGGRPAELAEWAHEAKVTLVAAALRRAYRAGADAGHDRAVEIQRIRDAPLTHTLGDAAMDKVVREVEAEEAKLVCLRWEASWTACGRGLPALDAVTSDRGKVTCPDCLQRVGTPGDLWGAVVAFLMADEAWSRTAAPADARARREALAILRGEWTKHGVATAAPILSRSS